MILWQGEDTREDNTCQRCPAGTPSHPAPYVCDGCGEPCCRIVKVLPKGLAYCNVCREKTLQVRGSLLDPIVGVK